MPPSASEETLSLHSPALGGIEARFAPQAGMIGCSLEVGGGQVLGQRNGLGAYIGEHSTMGIPLLYPWANRLGALEFTVAGRKVRIDPDSPRVKVDDNGLPMHGLLAADPAWEVTGHDPDGEPARLAARYTFDEAELTEAFPFPHTLELEVELRGAELAVRSTVSASAGSPVPVAYGFHPYLHLPGAPRQEWEISAPVADRLPLDDRGLPTGERDAAGLTPGPLGDRAFDDAFTSSGAEPFVLAAGGRRLELTLERGYPYCQLYSPAGADLIAFEPMTAPTNALVSGDGLVVLEPGESHEAAFRIAVAEWSGATSASSSASG